MHDRRFRLFLTLLLLTACSPMKTPAADLAEVPPDLGQDAAAPLRPVAVVSTSDFTSGALSTIDLDRREVKKGLDVLDAQTVVRAFGDRVYVLDQTHGVARVYQPARSWKDPSEFATGTAEVPAAQANPHDIYVDAATQRAFVTFYGSFGSTKVTGQTALAVFDLRDPSRNTRFIPLAVAAADTDGNPDADRLFACGGTLYVTLQDLDRNKMYRPAGPARLAAIPLPAADKVEYIQLAGQNPTAVAVPGGDCSQVLVGQGDYQLGGGPTGKGGVERVDLMARKSLGLALSDQELGGNVSALDAADGKRVFVDLVTKRGMAYEHSVYAVDVTARRKGEKVLGPLNYVPAVRVHRDRLLVLSAGVPAAGQLKAGVYLGGADGQPLPGEPLDVGLPPLSIDIFETAGP